MFPCLRERRTDGVLAFLTVGVLDMQVLVLGRSIYVVLLPSVQFPESPRKENDSRFYSTTICEYKGRGIEFARERENHRKHKEV